MIWTRFRQKHENFRKSDPGSPRFFCFKHFFRSWSTCGNLKICCNFQWVLVVVRDVEKESGIESEGLQKKANFFRKRVFAATTLQKLRVSRVLRVLRVLRALRALRALWFQWFALVFSSRRCFGLSLQLIVLLRPEANFEFQKCAVTSSSFRRSSLGNTPDIGVHQKWHIFK